MGSSWYDDFTVNHFNSEYSSLSEVIGPNSFGPGGVTLGPKTVDYTGTIGIVIYDANGTIPSGATSFAMELDFTVVQIGDGIDPTLGISDNLSVYDDLATASVPEVGPHTMSVQSTAAGTILTADGQSLRYDGSDPDESLLPISSEFVVGGMPQVYLVLHEGAEVTVTKFAWAINGALPTVAPPPPASTVIGGAGSSGALRWRSQ